MRQKLWILAAALCLCALLAGCGSKGGQNGGIGTPPPKTDNSQAVETAGQETPEADQDVTTAGGDQIGDSDLRSQADAQMEKYYGLGTQLAGEQSYTFQEAYETMAGYYRYIYRVDRTSDLLDQWFLVWVKIEKNGRVCVPSRMDLDVMEVNREQNGGHTWKLEGTYTYSDAEHDYTVTITAVEEDTVTLTYSIADNFGGLARNEVVDTPQTVEIVENYRGDERYADWGISITDGNDAINLYPFGAELMTGGTGSGMSIEGCWLTKN